METFVLRISTGNAAFEAAPNREIARILSRLATELKDDNPVNWPLKLRDINGNVIGSATFE